MKKKYFLFVYLIVNKLKNVMALAHIKTYFEFFVTSLEQIIQDFSEFLFNISG